MTKSFIGVRLRRLREERGMQQSVVAKALEISPSYYNQLENNQRDGRPAVEYDLSYETGCGTNGSFAAVNLRISVNAAQRAAKFANRVRRRRAAR
jgi:transcriptional regulator with XRE-family HTH domain